MMRLLGKLICLVALPLVAGCAQRTLIITSEPSGALVYLNGEEVGRTPLQYDFDWYADYDLILRKDGYETLKTHRKLKAPFYAIPPIDLFAELFGTKDRQEWNFEMAPAKAESPDAQAMINRGEALRMDLQSSQYTRGPMTRPATQPATQPTTQPTAQPATQPTTQPTTQPAK